MKIDDLKFNGCMYCRKGIMRFIFFTYEQLRNHIARVHPNKVFEFKRDCEDYIYKNKEDARNVER